jgi:RNA polymerase sigma factor (sigma-70 family)
LGTYIRNGVITGKRTTALENSATSAEFWQRLEPLYQRLYAFALSLTRSREAAEDLVSDSVLASLKNFPEMRDRQAFEKFVFTVTVRTYRKSIRRNWRFEPIENTEYSVDGRAEEDLAIGELYTALDTLSPKERETVVLFEVSGFSLEEIKTIQGGSLSGVKSRLRRGRERLAKQLREPVQILITNSESVKHSMTAL